MESSSNLWSRRANNNSKLSLSTSNSTNGERNGDRNGERNSSISKRFGGDSSSHGGKNPFNSVTTPGSGVASPGGAFALGTGAFSGFAKTPKSPGNPFEAVKGPPDKPVKDVTNGNVAKAAENTRLGTSALSKGKEGSQPSETPLHQPWSVWFRPAIPKNVSIPYHETVHGLAEVSTVEQFWAVYRHLARPSTLQPVSDYHLFKKGVRPIWEDDENRNGGKFLVRLKKGVADRYWEDIMLALIGEQFNDAGVEICGAVISVRNGEDIISVWTAAKEGKMIKFRDTFKKILKLPANTKIEWKVHEESIQQRITIEESRKEKANQHHRGKQNQRHQGNSEPASQA